ncbi:UDP-2,3-diacylglucosamine diphosphatase [Legionella fairfieldensis]|uniref:UDP-2,3-diacylglucosamine diphosphatase n=1 Tax=Legionella fairfieldensis TaxID=45064 RepID=UPI00048D725A|nr:UDP-2,3-diacylglucosamine diphosphatase [Legionella fairfieldensis]
MLTLQDKACEAVFISDLHLHPDEPLILKRFTAFIEWAAINTQSVYILGDFFHAWAGDDGLDDWGRHIALRLKWLTTQGVNVYFMHGNRDFLVGKDFARHAGITILSEPTVIQLGDKRVLLVHGDRYCTKDKTHQWFRWLTRNRLFIKCFLSIPFSIRVQMVNKVRRHSQMNKQKSRSQMDVIQKPMLKHMAKHKVNMLIHGHTHKPGLSNHVYNSNRYSQYVLSDWDESPQVLCYYKTNIIEFNCVRD